MGAGTLGRSHTQANILLATCIASFLLPFMSSALNLATPAISAELHASVVQVNWVVTAYLVASPSCLLPFGRLGDVAGRKKLFVTGMSAWAVFSVASAGMALTSLALVLFAKVMGNARIGRETAPLILASSHAIFALLAMFCAAGILASLARGRVQRH